MLWQDTDQSIVDAGRRSAPDLPATFDQGFEAAWSNGQLFSDNLAQGNARAEAARGYLDEVYQKTGKRLDESMLGLLPGQTQYDKINAEVAKLDPDGTIPPFSDEEIDRRATDLSKAARTNYQNIAGREQTFGSRMGMLGGSLAAGVVDPVNLVAAAVVPEVELGILGKAAVGGLFGLASQTINEAANAPYREKVQPGYGASGEASENILEAGVGGFALTGAVSSLGNLWTRMKTGAWPQSVRDAGNVVESEANIQQSNILPPNAEGEVAHREALGKAIDDVVAGRGVEAPASVSTIPSPQAGGVVAYHGSPHDFERFDASKIGTGEGAQSYGHGLYFAEQPKVAEEYVKDSAARNVETPGQREASYALPMHDGDADRAIEYLQRKIQEPHYSDDEKATFGDAVKEIKAGWRPSAGSLYKVHIAADREHFLDWDKPLSQQSELVKQRVSKALDVPIDKMHDQLFLQKASRETSDKLRDAGIPGIKYLDQGSRPVSDAAARAANDRVIANIQAEIDKGGHSDAELAKMRETQDAMRQEPAGTTRNFVVFDDKIVHITHKNGQPLDLFGSHEAKLDHLMDQRDAANGLTEQAKTERLDAQAAGELPLKPSATEAKSELHVGVLTDGIGNVARMAGYEMPQAEAAALAKRVTAAKTDDEARAILNEVAARPRTVADTVPSVSAIAKAERANAPGEMPDRAVTDQIKPEAMQAALTDPQHATALATELDRMRMLGDKQIPAGVDEKGEAVYRSLDGALDDIKADHDAADQLEACINPAPEPEAA